MISKSYSNYLLTKAIKKISETKSKLFDSLPTDGYAFKNIDDPFILKMDTKAKIISYGFSSKADFAGKYDGDKLYIDGIDINEGVVTPDEKIITSLANRMNETLNMNGSYPLVYSRERYELNHL